MNPPAALIGLFALAALPARAGEAPCRYELGSVVVQAQAAGLAGDFILDTAQPISQLHETRAQGEGLSQPAVTGDVALAGVVLRGRTLVVADLDLRTWAFPTPIAGVIGADLLTAHVLDVRFSPCRVTLSEPGRAPPFGAQERLPITWLAGQPTVPAAVGDARLVLQGDFAVSTASDRAVRLDGEVAGVMGAEVYAPDELYLWGNLAPRLAALTLAGQTIKGPSAGLLRSAPGGPVGRIGPAGFDRRDLRFDFPAGRLLLGPSR